ncbi:MAG: hypothetical protein EXS35_13075 [Pedosphaera sp.]|nr:hypothetical protein [Pedosphaera sp.]
MTKAVRIVIVIGIIVAVIGALIIRGQRSRARSALAAYKAALRAKGEKLTVEELGYPRPPESSTNLNLLLAGVDQIASVKFEPGSLELMRFVGAGRAEVTWAEPELRAVWSWGAKTNAATWEIFSSQFATNAEALQDIRDAVQVPPRYFYNDPTNFPRQMKAPFVQMRKAAQWLAGDAVAALHAGHLDRACTDVHALTQLSQFNREDLTLVCQMIRTAIVGSGLAVTWEALQARGWSEENLAAQQKDWETVDVADAFERGMIGERAWGEATITHMRALGARERADFFRFGGYPGGNPPSRRSAEDFFSQFVLMPLWAANSEADEMFFLQFHQKSLDAFRLLRTGTPMVEINRQLKTNVDELVSVIDKPLTRYRYLFSAIAIPNFTRAGQTCIRHETQRRLTITVIALERFRLSNGKLPKELDALVPQFLSAVQIDPMSAKPLCYRTNADGSFTLYSVGEDGRDDGGDPNASNVTNKFGLWEGKDAVWPAPVK